VQEKVKAKRPSQLVGVVGEEPATTKRRKTGKRAAAANKPVILPLNKVLELIGRLYMEKAKADHWIEQKEQKEGDAPADTRQRRTSALKKLQKVRFDAFVLKHFKSLHGTKAIARRHLRNFVVSVQHLAKEHARVDVFRKLAGIPSLSEDDAEPYIPSLVVRYAPPPARTAPNSPALTLLAQVHYPAHSAPRRQERGGREENERQGAVRGCGGAAHRPRRAQPCRRLLRLPNGRELQRAGREPVRY
jgi:hypothetical protein